MLSVILSKLTQNKQILFFLFAGGLNTIVGYFFFVLVFYLVGNKEIAVVVSASMALVFNYYSYRILAFSKRKNHNFIKFIIVFITVIGLNILHLKIFVDGFGINTYLAQFIALLYLPIISYFLLNKFVYTE